MIMQIESEMPKWNNNRVPPLDLSSVTICPVETEKRWNSLQKNISRPQNKSNSNSSSRTSRRQQLGSDGLPIDPRDWSRSDVWKWLTTLAESEGLEVSPELTDKFSMNGKALCLMNLEMYMTRVPCGGKMLYRDFRVRLGRAMALYNNNNN